MDSGSGGRKPSWPPRGKRYATTPTCFCASSDAILLCLVEGWAASATNESVPRPVRRAYALYLCIANLSQQSVTVHGLGHCVYAPSIGRAVELGTKEAGKVCSSEEVIFRTRSHTLHVAGINLVN